MKLLALKLSKGKEVLLLFYLSVHFSLHLQYIYLILSDLTEHACSYSASHILTWEPPCVVVTWVYLWGFHSSKQWLSPHLRHTLMVAYEERVYVFFPCGHSSSTGGKIKLAFLCLHSCLSNLWNNQSPTCRTYLGVKVNVYYWPWK